MSETKRDYEMGYGKPPREGPFREGQSGNPRGKSLPARLAGALNEPIYATINGRRRKITQVTWSLFDTISAGRSGLGDPKRQRVDTPPHAPHAHDPITTSSLRADLDD